MENIDMRLVKEIKSKIESPIITVIGASWPQEYNPTMGRDIGFMLRSFVQEHGGTVCTGGVSGVGIDIYRGVVDYCLNSDVKDRFSVLVPEYDYELVGRKTITVLYTPPKKYDAMAQELGMPCVNAIMTGQDMEERRAYLANVSDALIMVNGSGGTLDEALTGIDAGKNIIALPYTGGMAHVFGLIKERHSQPKFRKAVIEQLKFDPSSIHEHIYIADDLDALEDNLMDILDLR